MLSRYLVNWTWHGGTDTRNTIDLAWSLVRDAYETPTGVTTCSNLENSSSHAHKMAAVRPKSSGGAGRYVRQANAKANVTRPTNITQFTSLYSESVMLG